MQTILIVSIILNVLLASALIYLYCTRDRHRQRQVSEAFVSAATQELLQASARAEYANIVAIGRKVAESIPDAPPVFVGNRIH